MERVFRIDDKVMKFLTVKLQDVYKPLPEDVAVETEEATATAAETPAEKEKATAEPSDATVKTEEATATAVETPAETEKATAEPADEAPAESEDTVD